MRQIGIVLRSVKLSAAASKRRLIKAFSAIALCAAVFSAPLFAAPDQAPKVKPVSEFNIADHAGHFVYLDIWASWCGPCKQSFPFLNALEAHYDDTQLQVVGISIDTQPGAAQRFVENTPTIFKVYSDPTSIWAKKLKIKGMPSSFLYDPNGKIIYAHNGFQASDKAQIVAEIERVLKAYADAEAEQE